MEISNLLKANDFNFNKSFGQNFIFDTNLLKAIVEDCDLSTCDDVLEIGTGAGTLTKQISFKAKSVTTYEIDKNLKPILEKNFEGINNIDLNFCDIMKKDLKDIEAKFSSYKMIANLPYYITTPIIFKFLKSSKLKQMNIMVQKEVAERICAKKGKDYGVLSVIMDFYGNAKIMRIVDRKMFNPQPNVDSAIVRYDLVHNKYQCDNLLFERVVKASFAMRRKTLANNLKKEFDFTNEQIDTLLSKFVPSVRGETLSILEFVELTNQIKQLL